MLYFIIVKKIIYKLEFSAAAFFRPSATNCSTAIASRSRSVRGLFGIIFAIKIHKTIARAKTQIAGKVILAL